MRETFTLRISTEQNERIKELSKKVGASQNSLILQFIECGLNMFDRVSPDEEEFRHFLSQKQK